MKISPGENVRELPIQVTCWFLLQETYRLYRKQVSYIGKLINNTLGKEEYMNKIAIMFFCTMLLFARASLATSIEEAKVFFNQYVQSEQSFDPAAADMYAEDALIKNKRTYPTGQVRELTMPASQYKTLIRQAMPLAKLRGDTNTYSEVSYSKEGSMVRIRATRFSNLKKYSSPISLLVDDHTGRLLIYEEISESRP